MIIKDLEFILKKIIPEKFLLKKRIQRSIKKGYEKELEIINQFTDKSKDAIDVGVYRGIYSYKLAQHFKFVHCFEANPLLYPLLNDNLKKIIKNINLYNLALSSDNGETILKLPLRSKSFFKKNIEELYELGAASVHPNNKFNNFKEVKVKKKKLDSIKFENKIGFIKIDVEGHELEVIEGALKTIKENKPVLLVEIEEKHSKRMVIDSIKYIENIGYKCYFEKNKELLHVEKLKNVNEEFNFFFLPNIAK